MTRPSLPAAPRSEEIMRQKIADGQSGWLRIRHVEGRYGQDLVHVHVKLDSFHVSVNIAAEQTLWYPGMFDAQVQKLICIAERKPTPKQDWAPHRCDCLQHTG